MTVAILALDLVELTMSSFFPPARYQVGGCMYFVNMKTVGLRVAMYDVFLTFFLCSVRVSFETLSVLPILSNVVLLCVLSGCSCWNLCVCVC